MRAAVIYVPAPYGFCCTCAVPLTRAESQEKSHRCGWAMRSVGCYWTHPEYPSAVVSTRVQHLPGGKQQSGYVATVNFAELGLFATRELAQRAVEAYLGVE